MNVFHDMTEPPSVTMLILPFSVPALLFIQMTEQMKRFDTNVSSVKCPFERVPKVFESVRMDMALHVLYSMVKHLMNEIRIQIFVGF